MNAQIRETHKKSRRFRIIVCFAVPVAIFTALLLYAPILAFAQLFGDCRLYTLTGILCPTCGCTRATTALATRLDIVAALRFNLLVPFGVIVGIAAYAQNLLCVLGKRVRLVPRSWVFWTITGGIFVVYFVLRNIFSFF